MQWHRSRALGNVLKNWSRQLGQSCSAAAPLEQRFSRNSRNRKKRKSGSVPLLVGVWSYVLLLSTCQPFTIVNLYLEGKVNFLYWSLLLQQTTQYCKKIQEETVSIIILSCNRWAEENLLWHQGKKVASAEEEEMSWVSVTARLRNFGQQIQDSWLGRIHCTDASLLRKLPFQQSTRETNTLVVTACTEAPTTPGYLVRQLLFKQSSRENAPQENTKMHQFENPTYLLKAKQWWKRCVDCANKILRRNCTNKTNSQKLIIKIMNSWKFSAVLVVLAFSS